MIAQAMSAWLVSSERLASKVGILPPAVTARRMLMNAWARSVQPLSNSNLPLFITSWAFITIWIFTLGLYWMGVAAG